MKRLHIEFDLLMPDVKTHKVTAFLALQKMLTDIDIDTRSELGTTKYENLKIKEIEEL